MRGAVLLALFVAAFAGGCAMDADRPAGPATGLAGVPDGDTEMTSDEEAIGNRYGAMFRAMIAKDRAAMNELHADSFVLVHMTGERMDKTAYLAAVQDGILNYYAAEHDAVEVAVDGDRATLCGRSRVTAAVYGGGRHAWRLRQDMTLERIGGVWKFTSSQASTY